MQEPPAAGPLGVQKSRKSSITETGLRIQKGALKFLIEEEEEENILIFRLKSCWESVETSEWNGQELVREKSEKKTIFRKERSY